MHDTKRISVMEDIYGENDHIAEHVNDDLSGKGIFAINVMGAPGIGKTTTIINLINNIKGLVPYVIEGDIESDLDTRKLKDLGVKAYQINTFGACHLDAPLVHNMTQNVDFDEEGILYIENVGNLVCPAEFNIGEHIKLLICSVTEGGDKPYKYPAAFENADIILLNKTDLIPYLDFDEEFFMRGVRALNKIAPVFKVSGKTGEGFEEAGQWISQNAEKYISAGKKYESRPGHEHGQKNGSKPEHNHEHEPENGSKPEHNHEHEPEDGSKPEHNHEHELKTESEDE